MKKVLLTILVILLLMASCPSRPNEYPFPNRGEPIESVELLRYPFGDDSRRGGKFVFRSIRFLSEEEIPVFMEALYSLPTWCAKPTPNANYGEYIARVTYSNGDTEYFGSQHFELVKKGEEPIGVGTYYFPGETFEELFHKYAYMK